MNETAPSGPGHSTSSETPAAELSPEGNRYGLGPWEEEEATLTHLHTLEAEGARLEYTALVDMNFDEATPTDPLGVLAGVHARMSASTHPSERIWTGPGWHRLIAELDAQLGGIDPQYAIVQVKEKFGGLRYYVRLSGELSDTDRERCQNLVRSAEGASWWMCEICGRAAHLRGRTKVRTLCDTHAHYGVYSPTALS